LPLAHLSPQIIPQRITDLPERNNASNDFRIARAQRCWQNGVLMDEAAALKQFQEAYRGTNIVVRFYPRCVTSWRWQFGINGDGEHFELLAYGIHAD
jgi:hypothetical protein